MNNTKHEFLLIKEIINVITRCYIETKFENWCLVNWKNWRKKTYVFIKKIVWRSSRLTSQNCHAELFLSTTIFPAVCVEKGLGKFLVCSIHTLYCFSACFKIIRVGFTVNANLYATKTFMRHAQGGKWYCRYQQIRPVVVVDVAPGLYPCSFCVALDLLLRKAQKPGAWQGPSKTVEYLQRLGNWINLLQKPQNSTFKFCGAASRRPNIRLSSSVLFCLLGKENLPFIIDYSRWVLKSRPEYGLKVRIILSDENVNVYIFIYLSHLQTRKKTSGKYLENLILSQFFCLQNVRIDAKMYKI